MRRRLQIIDEGLQTQIDAIDTSGGGAPTSAAYVTATANGTLTGERVLTAGTGISVTDNGANSTIVIAATGSGAPTNAQYVTLATNGSLSAERVLTQGTAISITDGGANGPVTVAVDESGLVLWEQVRDIDCSTEAANNWDAGGDGTYSLGGLTWNIVNTARSDTFGPDGSTGVRFNATAGVTTAFDNASQTATYIWLLATTLIPSFNPLSDYIVEYYYSSLTLSTTGDAVGLILWNSTGARVARGGRRNTSGTQQTCLRLDGNENGTGYSDNAFALRFNATNAAVASGTYAAGFPSAYPHLGAMVSLAVATPLQNPILDPASLRIGFAWLANTAGNADSTLARIRVWRRRGFA